MVGVERNEEMVDDNDDRAMAGNEGVTVVSTSDPRCCALLERGFAPCKEDNSDAGLLSGGVMKRSAV